MDINKASLDLSNYSFIVTARRLLSSNLEDEFLLIMAKTEKVFTVQKTDRQKGPSELTSAQDMKVIIQGFPVSVGGWVFPLGV